MAFYVSVDAGGSKCSAILFGDDFKLLGAGLSGGVNRSQGATAEHARKNVAECLENLFAGFRPERVETCYGVFVGDDNILKSELKKFTDVKKYIRLGEIEAGLRAGALLGEGILALSGTGSNIGYIGENPPRRESVGGWGPILGDQGSGAWIGQKALQAAVAAHEGWGEPTVLLELIKKAWNLENDWYMVNEVYQSEAPFRKAASVAPIAGEAAGLGDKVSLKILREAGGFMATQVKTLVKKIGAAENYPPVICCGGAWKTHASMFGVFCGELEESLPGIEIHKPWFEHVVAGAAFEISKRGINREEGRNMLSAGFGGYIINW